MSIRRVIRTIARAADRLSSLLGFATMRTLRTWVCSAAVGSAFCAIALGQQPNAPTDIPVPKSLFFTVPSDAPDNTPAPSDDAVVRQQPIGVDFNLLAAARRREVKTLRLNLFADLSLDVSVQNIVFHSPKTYSLVGAIGGKRDNWFTLTINEDEGLLLGSVSLMDGGHYQVGGAASRGFVARQIDPRSLSFSCGADEGAKAKAAALPLPPPPMVWEDADDRQDDGRVFDVLVVYTPAAKTTAEGLPLLVSIEIAVNTAILHMNLALKNSHAIPRVRLVHMEQVDYTEEGFMLHGDLISVQDPGDGVMDNVHALRNQYNADLVDLMVCCGLIGGNANLLKVESISFESQAFSVVLVGVSPAPVYAFAHELAHNMGCAHNVGGTTNQGDGVFHYSHGWVEPTNNYFQTIMCAVAGIMKIGHYSNPFVLDDVYNLPTGRALGLPDEADNALTIDQTAATVANFRLSAPPVLHFRTYGNQVALIIDAIGNFRAKSLVGGANPSQLIPAADDAWLVKDSTGAVVVRLDFGGTLYLKGQYAPFTTPLTLVDEILTIKDAGGIPVAFIDKNGNLKLKGGAVVIDF